MTTPVKTKQAMDVYKKFRWKTEDLWKLDLPRKSIPLAALVWHFDILFQWNTMDGNIVDATVNDIFNNPKKHVSEILQIKEVDTSFPLIVIEHNRKWIILDGIRRLAKSYISGQKNIKVSVLPKKLVSFRF